jgi:hypothetical protein
MSSMQTNLHWSGHSTWIADHLRRHPTFLNSTWIRHAKWEWATQLTDCCQDVNANVILIIDNEQLNSPTECQHVYANVILIINNEQLYSPTEFM